MKRILAESFNEFVHPEEDDMPQSIESTDAWEDDEEEDIEELDVDATDMTDVEDIEIDVDPINDESLFTILSNEIKIPEPDRRVINFKLKGNYSELSGVPMAKLGNDAFLFKLENGIMKKIKIKDMILENSRAKLVKESLYDNEEWAPEESQWGKEPMPIGTEFDDEEFDDEEFEGELDLADMNVQDARDNDGTPRRNWSKRDFQKYGVDTSDIDQYLDDEDEEIEMPDVNPAGEPFSSSINRARSLRK